MKKTKLWFATLSLLLVAASTGFAGCATTGEDSQSVPPGSSVERPDSSSGGQSEAVGIRLSDEEIELDLHEAYTLHATVENSEEKVTWKSSDTNVVTVDDEGTLRSVAVGSATVTASVGGVSATCSVEVYDSETAPVLTVSESDIVFGAGETYTLTAAVTYKDQTPIDPVEYTWAIEEGDAYIGIAPDGGKLTVTGEDYGSAKIKVSAELYGVPMTQTISVTIKTLDVTFDMDGEGVTVNENGYLANLAMIETETDISAVTPEITVRVKGEETELVEDDLTWTVADESVVTVDENGRISAAGVGETIITYHYQNNDLLLYVNVYRPEIAVDTREILLDAGRDATLDAGDIQGKIIGLKTGETDIFGGAEGGVISLDTAALSTVALGDTEVIIETDKADYLYEGGVYSYVVRTADDLAGLFSKIQADPDGYFVFGADIDFTGRTYASDMNTTFIGTIDGRGHIVNGFSVTADVAGLVPWCETGAVIKDLVFTNAGLTGGGGFISTRSRGKVENIYISLSVTAKTAGGWEGNTSVLVADMMLGYSATNVFIEYKYYQGNYDWEPKLGLGHASYSLYANAFNGVYAVGADRLYDYAVTADAEGTVVGEAYMTYDALADDADFSEWEGDFWTVVNGLPVPKVLAEQEINVSIDNAETSVSAGTSFLVETDGWYEEVTVDEAAAAAGVTVQGNYITIPAGVNIETITLTLTSKIDGTKTATKDIRVYVNLLVDYEGRASFDMTEESVEIDLSDYAENIIGTLVSVSVGDSALSVSDFTYADNKLTFVGSVFADYAGLKDVTFLFERMNGEEVTGRTTLTVPVEAITFTVRTADDLAGLFAKIQADPDGYFVFGADIDFTGRTYTSDMNTTFIGTIDGRGHIVNGFSITADASGLVPKIDKAGAVIKNLVFTNAELTGAGGFISSQGSGKIENIYISISVTSKAIGNWYDNSAVLMADTMAGYTATNVFIEYKYHKPYYQWDEFGQALYALYDNALNGVYAVGIDRIYCSDKSGGSAPSTIVGGAYLTYAEFAAASIDFSGWEGDFWTVVNGIPVPKALAEQEINVSIDNAETSVSAGTSFLVETDGWYEEVTVDEAAAAAGVTVVGNYITIPAGTELTQITVTLTSKIDGTKTAMKVFTVQAAA